MYSDVLESMYLVGFLANYDKVMLDPTTVVSFWVPLGTMYNTLHDTRCKVIMSKTETQFSVHII